MTTAENQILSKNDIELNIKEVQNNILKACLKAGRNTNEVTLIAVSKTKPVSMLEDAYACGMRYFGENKVQEITEKRPVMPSDATFHMIGHLQSNKINQLLGKVSLIHSVDSIELAEQISKKSIAKGLKTDILVEVNVAGEDSKFGITPEDTEHFVTEIAKYPGIHVRGLMTIAPFVDDAEENRLIFRKLKQLCVDLKTKNIDNTDMDILSMGMTNDYMVAIEEGATMVRVGTGIFGARAKNISL